MIRCVLDFLKLNLTQYNNSSDLRSPESCCTNYPRVIENYILRVIMSQCLFIVNRGFALPTGAHIQYCH